VLVKICTGYQASEKVGNTDYFATGDYMHWWGETPETQGFTPVL
jgi:hypothetical protein